MHDHASCTNSPPLLLPPLLPSAPTCFVETIFVANLCLVYHTNLGSRFWDAITRKSETLPLDISQFDVNTNNDESVQRED